MKEKSMYFARKDIYEKIKALGGTWTDPKNRPIVCLIKSAEHDGLYWAIPVGMYDHRDEKGIKRLNTYLERPEDDLRSCYYHIGRTTCKSIFFISDVFPITDKYIEKIYKGYDNQIYTIKNNKLLKSLYHKLSRILSFENSRKNYFRQHITSIKEYLIKELEEDSKASK